MHEKMLKPAILYKEEIEREIRKRYYTDAMFYASASLDNSSEGLFQYAILDTDEKKYEEFKKHIVARDGVNSIKFWHKDLDDIVSDDIITNGKTKHAFGGYTKLLGYAEDIKYYDEESMLPMPKDKLFQKLSEIIEQGSACVITEVGNNELRYLGAQVSIITHNNYETFKLEEIVKKYLLNKKDIVQHDIDMWF